MASTATANDVAAGQDAPPVIDTDIDSAWPRVLLAASSVISLIIGVVAYAFTQPDLQAGALLYFCLVGIGSAPLGLVRRLSFSARTALTFACSMTVLTATSVVMSDRAQWHPFPAFVVVAAICGTLHVAGLVRATREIAQQHRHTTLAAKDSPSGSHRRANGLLARVDLAVTLVVLGAACWLTAALTHRHIDPGFGGFLTKIGPLWYVGVVLVLFGLFAARNKPERVAAFAVVVLMLALTLTPAIVYDGARATTAAKHVGLIQQIRTGHRLDTVVPIYNAWNGFFGAMAWLSDIMGIKDPNNFSAWWPPVIGFFRLGALRFLAGRFLSRSYHAWTAVALCVLVDAIGADYYSPQSVGYILGITAFAVALGSGRVRTRSLTLLTIGCILAVTHQLSPYVTAGVLVVLVVFRQVRPWWTPLLILAPAGGWALLHRSAVKGFVNLSEIGHAQNFSPPKTVGIPGLVRMPIVAQASYALILGIAVVALIAGVSVLRFRDKQVFAMGFSAVVGFVFVAANPYGNEGIFRALLFAIPWLVLLAMRWITTRSWVEHGLTALQPVMVGLLGTFLITSFSLDALNVVQPGDLLAYQTFEATPVLPGEAPAFLMQIGPGNLPVTLPARSARKTELDRQAVGDDMNEASDQDPVLEVGRVTADLLRFTAQDPQNANLYAVWSPLSLNFARAYAIERPATFIALRDAFLNSGYWAVVTEKGGTILFRFDPAGYAATSTNG